MKSRSSNSRSCSWARGPTSLPQMEHETACSARKWRRGHKECDINILGKMAQKIWDKLPHMVDVVRHQGRQDGSSQTTVIWFTMRFYHGIIWKATQESRFLLEDTSNRMSKQHSRQKMLLQGKDSGHWWLKKLASKIKRLSFSPVNRKKIDCQVIKWLFVRWFVYNTLNWKKLRWAKSSKNIEWQKKPDDQVNQCWFCKKLTLLNLILIFGNISGEMLIILGMGLSVQLVLCCFTNFKELEAHTYNDGSYQLPNWTMHALWYVMCTDAIHIHKIRLYFTILLINLLGCRTSTPMHGL